MPKTEVTRRFLAWSFSRWWEYNTCPRMAARKHLDKLGKNDVQHPAAVRGEAIHKLGELFTLKKMKEMPAALKSFKPEFLEMEKNFRAEFKAMQVKGTKCEEQLTISKTWKLLPANAWFNNSLAWLRVKMDNRYEDGDTMVLTDLKTGKIKSEHKLQLSLYGLTGFTISPKIKKVVARLLYLDHGPESTVEETYTRKADAADLKTEWLGRIKNMFEDVQFKPRPGFHCRFCPDSKDKGGTCRF